MLVSARRSACFFLQAIWFKIWAVLSARQPFMECSQRRCQHLTYVQRIGLKRPFFSVFTLGGMALFNIFQIPSIVPVCTFNTPDLRPCICDKSHIARTHLSFTSSFYTNNCIEPHLCLCTEPHVLTESLNHVFMINSCRITTRSQVGSLMSVVWSRQRSIHVQVWSRERSIHVQVWSVSA